MNRMKLFSFWILTVVVVMVDAQNTYYYQPVANPQDSIVADGGQFVSFICDICYESTAAGLSVGNGTLRRLSAFGPDANVYLGSSYWGDSTTFRFSADRKELLVEQGGVLRCRYRQSVAAENVKTCSLIRNKVASSRADDPVVLIGDAKKMSYQSTANPHSSEVLIPNLPDPALTGSSIKCPFCNGTGVVK